MQIHPTQAQQKRWFLDVWQSPVYLCMYCSNQNVWQNTKIFGRKVHGVNGEYLVLSVHHDIKRLATNLCMQATVLALHSMSDNATLGSNQGIESWRILPTFKIPYIVIQYCILSMEDFNFCTKSLMLLLNMQSWQLKIKVILNVT